MYLIYIKAILIIGYKSCPDKDPLCVKCNEGVCDECLFSYKVNGKCIVPKTIIEDCTHYKNESECSFCKEKFALD